MNEALAQHGDLDQTLTIVSLSAGIFCAVMEDLTPTRNNDFRNYLPIDPIL